MLLPFPRSNKTTGMRLPIFLMLLYGFIGWSVVLPIFGVPRIASAALVSVGTVLLCIVRRGSSPVWVRLTIAFVTLTTVIQCLYWTSPFGLRFAWFLSLSLLLIAHVTEDELSALVDVATALVAILLFGAVVAHVYQATGRSEWYTFARPGADEQSLLFFPFSLGLKGLYSGDVRLTGIYDEPGALSFVVCIVAFLREKLGRAPSVTWCLLLVGLVTFSLAHAIFIACFALAIKVNWRTLIRLMILGIAVITVLTTTPLGEDLQDKLAARIVGDEIEGRIIRGDNRSERMNLAFETLVGPEGSVWVGIKSDREEGDLYTDVGENPLTPLVRHGLLVSWPYYAYLIYGLIALFKGRESLAFFGVVLLLAQRPYLQSDGYSFLGILALWAQTRTGGLWLANGLPALAGLGWLRRPRASLPPTR